MERELLDFVARANFEFLKIGAIYRKSGRRNFLRIAKESWNTRMRR